MKHFERGMASTRKFLVVLSFMMYLVSTQSIHQIHLQHRFDSRLFHYLNVSLLEITLVNDYIDCSFACLQNAICVAFNVAVFSDEKRKLWCELLPETSYNNTAKLTSDHRSRHYSMQVSYKYLFFFPWRLSVEIQ